MNDDNLPRMCTIREAARLGVLPENALRTLNKEGRLPTVKVGNTYYINVTRLVHLLNHLPVDLRGARTNGDK